MNQLPKRLVLLAGFSALLGAAAPARAQDHSWRWPLYLRDDSSGKPITGQPRPAAWNSAGEYQEYNGENYLHPGHDIRGAVGDIVINPTSSTLEAVYRYQDDCVQTGTSCRLWFAANDNRHLYYFSHLDFADKPMQGGVQVTTEIREIVQNVAMGMATTPESRAVPVGTTVASLTSFSANWHHVHMGIFDRQAGYQMVNTISFLQQQAAGANGQSLLIIDDEDPTIKSISLVKDGTDTLAATSGTCGEEIAGKVDVLADMYDTFYTTGVFADFPGSELNPNTGIRFAGYSVRSVATGNVVDSGTWFDIAAAPLVCGADTSRGCLLPSDLNPPLSGFLARMNNSEGAPDVGLSVVDKLFNTGPSESEYATSGKEVYIHNLTNKQGLEGTWDTSAFDNGVYQITVEVEDFAFRRSAKSVFVTVHNATKPFDTNGAGFGDVFVRDRDDDVGAVPSNAGGEPFWQSPDIFVVPHGVPVTDDSFATQTAVQAGSEYDVWVRVKNSGCREVTNVQAKVRSANPAAINTNWLNVGSGAYEGSVNILPGKSRVVGPFVWKPTPEEATGDGHRCLLANIRATGDELASSAEFDAPGSNNVAQRNMRVTGCDFQIPNPATQNTQLALKLTTSAAVERDDTKIELVGPLIPSWYAAWQNTPGVVLSNDGTRMRVRMRIRDVTLPAVAILAGANYDFSFDISLPQGESQQSVSIEASWLGNKSGFSCFAAGQKVPT
jgi:hypothetical protein